MIPRGTSLIPRTAIRTISTRNTAPALLPTLSRSPEAKRQRLTADPVRMASTTQGDFGNYKQLSSFDIKYAPVSIGKWRSEKTGLSVVVGKYETPITNGHFAVASEIFDDTGRPHTLEHLVFLGSKSYPFKGVLDTLANRASSNGTNAWTASDHTAYTIATAGTAGFLKMLPIYIDHILHPTITDAGYVTEVHHINGQGEDAGVVYSEMQARENTAGDLMTLNAQRRLYPETSAYRSETGGLLSALRALDAQQIRDYHKAYYVPHNLCLVIDGAVSLPELFKVLNEEVEPMILENLKPAPWKRPFVETPTAKPHSIPESSTKVVEFMEEDESMGDIMVNWLGPPPMDYTTNLALSILNKYLTNSATAPLQKEFVEIPKPYCTGISFYAEDRVNKNELSCFISDVPMKHLDKMRDMLMAKLEQIKEEGIDMEKMALQIRRDKRKLLDGMEKGVSGSLADCAIGDFLYGAMDGSDLPAAFEDIRDYETISKITEKEWIELLDKYYISQPCLTTIGKPSASLSAKIEQDEKDRLAKRKAELGEEKLKELQKALDAAKEESDRPPPPEMITDFPLTDPKSLTWVPVETAINNATGETRRSDKGDVQRHVDSDKAELPYQAHFSHVKSNFVNISALFDTINVPTHLRPYFALYQAALFASSVKRSDGTVLTHEQVVDQLDDFTIDQRTYFGFRGRFSEVFHVELKVEKAEYEKAIGWMKDLITGLVFAPDRLEIIVAKMLQELPYEKRDGAKVADAYLYTLAYDNAKSTSESTSLLNMLEFLPATASALKEDPETVIKHLEEVRQSLLDPSIMRVSVRGDILGLPEPRSALARSFLPVNAGPLAPLSTAKDTLSAIGENPSKKCIIVPMPAIEGSFSSHYAKGPSGWDHPDLPALTLAVSVLNATESYLWKAVRGSGLAYGAYVSASAETGLTSYSVFRSPNAKLAYDEAGRVLAGLVDGTIELDQTIVDGARSSLTYSYAMGSQTVGAAAATAYLDEILKGVGKDQNKKMLETFPTITLDDIRRVIKLYLSPIFSSDTSICAVTVSSGKADEVEQGFKDLGFDTERKSLPALEGSEDGSEEGSEGEESDSQA